MKERLTPKGGFAKIENMFLIKGYVVNGIEVTDMLDRLAEYEDLEEQGLIVRLPCKVGDKVYLCIADEIFEWEVVSIEIFDFDTVLRLGHKGSVDYAAEYVSSLGKRLFATREEAEKELKELKGE